jgi:CDP-2,3-bis-(O-geranylgeranyl)-sn-glycerol synthase
MNKLLFDALAFAGPCWIVNLSHNFIVPLKKIFPALIKIDPPIDGGLRWGKNRILGGSITYAGLLVTLIMPFLLVYVFSQSFQILMLKSLSVYIGGALGSFIKRRLGYMRGEFMPIVDHGDYILFTSIIFYALKLEYLLVILGGIALTYIFHPIACYIGYKLKIKTEPI